jgi:hypothetical protein
MTFMLNQCLENTGEGLLHACISSKYTDSSESKKIWIVEINIFYPRANGAKRRSGVSPGRGY